MEELEMNTEMNVTDGLDKCENEARDTLPASDEEMANGSGEEPEENNPQNEEENEEVSVTVDYGEVERQDLEELRSLFPHLKDKTSITQLDNPLRYAALRDLGLTPKEAYLATSEPRQRYDNRSHLRSSVPKSAGAPADMLTRGELEAARELFSGLSDREIQKLYKKVSR